jgi:hypothetical protein
MFPVVICRHFDVVWLDTHTCYCRGCGKEGHWTKEGFAIWIKGRPRNSTYAKACSQDEAA